MLNSVAGRGGELSLDPPVVELIVGLAFRPRVAKCGDLVQEIDAKYIVQINQRLANSVGLVPALQK